ncbi:MAG: 50S ribosomal protein L20 [Phycisphaerae bacterium]|jgi:large subunit ribosomal protein L20|nr:50S ribosomal protein L20 [Phycisphaerae bacterium]
MPRARKGSARHKATKRLLKRAKGFVGARSKLRKVAKIALIKAGQNAYRDRRNKKRVIRQLWITRINAACRQRGLSYSRFIRGLKLADIELNRKVLADLAMNGPAAFDAIADKAKASLDK